MNYTDIHKRFKAAYEICTQKHGEKKRFCEKYKIDPANLRSAVFEPTVRHLRAEWIASFCKEYDVSTDYILLGNGPMFTI